MRIPGFTAEVSLIKSGECYRGSSVLTTDGGSAIVAQRYDRPIVIVDSGCYGSCRRAGFRASECAAACASY